MNLRVQGTPDLARIDHIEKSHVEVANTQRMARVEQEKPMEKLLKEEKPREKLEQIEVESAVESINDAVEHINRALRFQIHEDTQRMMVRVINVNTDEVIKELPPEDVLDTVARIREMIGLLIDERA